MRLALPAICLLLCTAGCKKEKSTIDLPSTMIAPDDGSKTSTAKRHKAHPPAAKPDDGVHRKSPAGGVATPTASDLGVLNGTTRALKVTTLAPEVSGRITKILVEEGAKVKHKDRLLELDRTDFLLGLRAARAARDTAKAQLNAVEVEWRRLRGLVAAKAIPRGQFERIDAQRAVALAGLAQAKVAIARGRASLAKTTIVAPFNAVVLKKLSEVGAYATVMPPTTLLMLANIDQIDVLVAVPERFMRQVVVGTKLELSFTALELKEVAPVSTVIPAVDPQTRSFTAVVRLANAQHRLRPGMFVEVRAAR